MAITKMDRALFFVRRFYNRTIGNHIFGVGHNNVCVLGFRFMLKSTVDQRFSMRYEEYRQAGLTYDEYLEIRECFESVFLLPRPEWPNCTYSERQIKERGILLFFNYVYVFIAD